MVLDKKYQRDPPPEPRSVPKKGAKELYLSRRFEEDKGKQVSA